MISLSVVAIGAVVAVAGTGVLAARSARVPSLLLTMWTLAAFGLAVGLGAQVLGYVSGYSPLIFRAMEVGAQAIAPLALCVGLVEITGRGVPARFAMRLAAAAVGVIVLVILGSDPLNLNATFGKTWPDPLVFYETVPKYLIEYLIAPFTAVTAVAAIGVAGMRSSRDQVSKDAVRPVMAGGLAALALALPGLIWLAHDHAGIATPGHAKDVFGLMCLIAAALTWWAGVTAASREIPQAQRAEMYPERDDMYPDDEWGADDIAGGGRFRTADAGTRGGPDDWYDERRPDRDEGSYPALAALAAEAIGPGSARDRNGAASGGYPDFAAPADAHGQLFGQIAIYTLIEDRVEEFDRLTEQVVAQVRAREPGTLVFIAHAVPTAPMQRILYAVYRDRSAYEEHLAQPYVVRYEAERQPFVLAANVIELGLQQAKVSPLPSISAISDILSESGIDLTGVTSSSRSRPGSSRDHDYGRGASMGFVDDPEPGGEAGSSADWETGNFRMHDVGEDRPYRGWAGVDDDDDALYK